MRDDLLDDKLSDAKRGNEPAARHVLIELAKRLLSGAPLTQETARALAYGVDAVSKGARSVAFVSREPKKRGRPPGSRNKKKPVTLDAKLRNIGAAIGEKPRKRATVGRRSLQRIAAEITGPGVAGRPKQRK